MWKFISADRLVCFDRQSRKILEGFVKIAPTGNVEQGFERWSASCRVQMQHKPLPTCITGIEAISIVT